MELYTFANIIDGCGTLRVKADHQIELLSGFHRIVERLSNCEIIHSFTLMDKIKTDVVGTDYYAWYTIKDYTNIIDSVSPIMAKIDANLDIGNTAFIIMSEQGNIPVEKMYQHEDVYGVWKPDVDYKTNNLRTDPEYLDGSYLFKCRNAHTSQAIFPPHIVPALWERVPKPGEGSHDNPIPYDASVGMTLENGKFYTEDGVLYKCFRDSGQPVYNTLESLIGIYVQVSN